MLKTTVITIGLCFLTGCGGSSSSTPITVGPGDGSTTVLPTIDLTGTFKYYGYVDITDDTVENRVNRGTNFLEMVVAQDAALFINSVPPAIDSCKLRITPTLPTDVGTIGFPDAQFTFVSAGDSFTLTSDAGTYATVSYADSRFDIAPYPVPENLTLDIPGQVFPAFSGITIPMAVSVQNFNPGRNQTLSAETTITWDTTGISDHSIYLEVFDLFASDKVVRLYCRMADDGSFTLPANIVSALNSSLGVGFELEEAKQDVVSVSVITQDDALLVVAKRLDFLF